MAEEVLVWDSIVVDAEFVVDAVEAWGCTLVGVAAVEVVVVVVGTVVAQHFHSLMSQTNLAQSDFHHRTDLYLPALPAGGKKTHDVASLLLGSRSMVGKNMTVEGHSQFKFQTLLD